MNDKTTIRKYTKNEILSSFRWVRDNLNISINDPSIFVSFDKRRIYSYGGWREFDDNSKQPYINLSLYECLDFIPQVFEEYEWYANDKDIGECMVNGWKDYVRLTIAHEVSHCVEFGQEYLSHDDKKRLIERFGKSTMDNSHGECFQKIYKLLRTRSHQ